jgi:hypothetical protein
MLCNFYIEGMTIVPFFVQSSSRTGKESRQMELPLTCFDIKNTTFNLKLIKTAFKYAKQLFIISTILEELENTCHLSQQKFWFTHLSPQVWITAMICCLDCRSISWPNYDG